MTLLSTQDRKKREFEEREQLLVKIADDILSTQGELALTMDKLVAYSEYSKGTVYNHFSCKEDLLSAIYYEKFKILFRLFKKVAAMPLPSRERELGLHVAHSLFDHRYFQESARLMAPNTSGMQEKVSPHRRVMLQELQQKFQKVLLDLIQEGIDEGDLRLPSGLTADMVAVANQALSFGMMTVMYGSCTGPDHQDLELFLYAHLEAASRLLDGYNWRPYSDACDYKSIVAKVEETLRDDFETLLTANS
jgi:AcrR family transcriptional regulator